MADSVWFEYPLHMCGHIIKPVSFCLTSLKEKYRWYTSTLRYFKSYQSQQDNKSFSLNIIIKCFKYSVVLFHVKENILHVPYLYTMFTTVRNQRNASILTNYVASIIKDIYTQNMFGFLFLLCQLISKLTRRCTTTRARLFL